MNEQQKQSNKYPLDDKIMTYDYITHRYVLTERGVFNELGVNLDAILNASGDANPSALATRILKRASETVYLWLYKDSWNAQWLEYVLATLPSLRATVKEMLQSQLLYMLGNEHRRPARQSAHRARGRGFGYANRARAWVLFEIYGHAAVRAVRNLQEGLLTC